jgi:hypothetical protein
MGRQKLTEEEKIKATNIRVHDETKMALEEIGKFGDTHDSIIKRLLDYYNGGNSFWKPEK